MDLPTGVVRLHHGTTLRRAERIIRLGPDRHYVEPGGTFHDPAGGFSTAEAGALDVGLLTPEDYARRKATNFPSEGGPVILEIEVPAWMADIVHNDPVLGPTAASGEFRFVPEVGLTELLQEWANLPKRIIPL